jgi:hypothetical protein
MIATLQPGNFLLVIWDNEVLTTGGQPTATSQRSSFAQIARGAGSRSPGALTRSARAPYAIRSPRTGRRRARQGQLGRGRAGSTATWSDTRGGSDRRSPPSRPCGERAPGAPA